ncbi:hypothetical protein TNCV_1189551 [Trichonephila clavipes]|nr:hypothetical protein TNCV_1189551 [Trichonephila clavipes]
MCFVSYNAANTVAIVHYCKLSQKKYRNDCPDINRCVRRKALPHTKTYLAINGNKYLTFQRAAGFSISRDFIDEVLDDVTSVMNLTEEERLKANFTKKTQINRTT